MTDERADAELKTAVPLEIQGAFEILLNERQAWFGDREQSAADVQISWVRYVLHDMPELWPLAAAAPIYSKAFVEALAKRHADGLADLVRTRLRKKGRRIEVEIGPDGRASAAVVVTEDMPDEARLALLDLDVTSDELRGKLLRWDSSASAWQPDPDQ